MMSAGGSGRGGGVMGLGCCFSTSAVREVDRGGGGDGGRRPGGSSGGAGVRRVGVGRRWRSAAGGAEEELEFSGRDRRTQDLRRKEKRKKTRVCARRRQGETGRICAKKKESRFAICNPRGRRKNRNLRFVQAVLEKQSYMLIGRHDIDNLLRLDPAGACLPDSLGQKVRETDTSGVESTEVDTQLSEILLNLRPIKQENLIRDDNKLILLASLSDSLEYVADAIERLGKSSLKYDHLEENGSQNSSKHTRTSSAPPKDLPSFAEEYRNLAIDCLKVLRIEMQLEAIFHIQEMAKREYLDDQDAEEPDDFVISLTSQVTRRDEEIAPFVADVKRNYIFGGICGIAANLSIKALAEMKSINIFGVQQICRNSIALEQALAAISSIDGEVVQMRLDRVRTYYELLNMPFEALLAFISEHGQLFSAAEYANLLKVQVPGREIPDDAQDRATVIMSH
ncbi:exocyst subunit [Orobanche minor]